MPEKDPSKLATRTLPRFSLSCPIRLYRQSGEIVESSTDEISCEEFSCYSFLPLTLGELVRCEITLGSDHKKALAEPVVLVGSAEVKAVIEEPSGFRVRLDCRLLGYTIAPAD
jgi:hypothetical protein